MQICTAWVAFLLKNSRTFHLLKIAATLQQSYWSCSTPQNIIIKEAVKILRCCVLLSIEEKRSLEYFSEFNFQTKFKQRIKFSIILFYFWIFILLLFNLAGNQRL